MDLFEIEEREKEAGAAGRRPKPRRTKRQGAAAVAVYGALAIMLSVFSWNCLMLTRVPTGSMEPAIMAGDYVFGNRLAFKKREPKAGDVVMFHKDGEFLVKRVVAVGGDEASFHDGWLYLNGEKADEPYLKDPDVETNSPRVFQVPEGSCLVLGDNREMSGDARYWDEPYVEYSNLTAKVMFVMPWHLVKPM